MPATARLSPTDEALVAALAAWGGVEALPLLRRFGAQRARGLAGALVPTPPAAPLELLRESGAAQSGPDPARVHKSWYIRALQDESPAVRRVVVSATREPLRTTLIEALGLSDTDLLPDCPAEPRACEVALTLWTERLVGDVPPRHGDPLAVRALTTLGPVGLYRLLRLCGLAKRAVGGEAAIASARRVTTNRLAALRSRLARPIDARLVQIAEKDWAAAAPLGRHRLAGTGLATLGRLFAKVEPYRVRWALQHVAYPVAKRLRIAASRPEATIREVQELEARVLDAAWDRLREEGRLA
ncbi:MAG TPA: hypothetical protein VGH33_22500 [Isosphaeraceae bacterium]